MATSLIIAIVVFNGLAIYPAFLSFGPDEGITDEDINAIDWMFENLDVNITVIASDHRLERYAEGNPYNFSTTGKVSDTDKAIKIWAAENISEYIYELRGTDHGYLHNNYSKITHVLIDNTMKYHSVHIGEKYKEEYMKNESRPEGEQFYAYDKFNSSIADQPVFNLIYRNESEARNSITGEAISWAEVYEVNWTYIETLEYIDKL